MAAGERVSCELHDGWSLAVEAFYNTDGRLYGDLTYGDEVYGDRPGAGVPEWQSLTSSTTSIELLRGGELPELHPGVSQLRAELVDMGLDLFDFVAPATYFDPDTGAPVRVVLVDPVGTRHELARFVIERIRDEHDSRVRVIELDAFGYLSQWTTPELVQYPTQSIADRYDAIAELVAPRHVEAPELDVDVLVSADPEPVEQTGSGALRVAASSAGAQLDETRTGAVRVRPWPYAWSGDAPVLVTDRLAIGDVAATVIGYVMDTEAMLNRVRVVHRYDDSLSRTADDVVSQQTYSRRGDALGFPAESAHVDPATAQAFADRVLARFAGHVKRPQFVEFDSRTDPRWFGVVAELDTGTELVVRRTGYAGQPIEHRCHVVGYELDAAPGRLAGRLYLATIEQTIGTSPELVTRPAGD